VDELADDVLDGARQQLRHDVEAVDRAIAEVPAPLVGDAPGRADERVVPRVDLDDQVADGQSVFRAQPPPALDAFAFAGAVLDRDRAP
jgi:hypothetical protein